MAVELEFGTFGSPENPPLLIIHGLLGSSRNWMSLGKDLAPFFNVFLLDLRNHGQSPHTDTHTYPELVQDLEHWLERKRLGKFFLLGHSMGGKVAMKFACQNPDRLHGLIVEDIAPREYPLRYAMDFELMNSLNLDSLQNRQQADDHFAQKIPDWAWRQFLLTNLSRHPETKQFQWQINLPTLTKELPKIMLNSLQPEDQYPGPTLFIQGQNSDFICCEDKIIINKHFPRNALIKIPEAGHNVHVDNKIAVLDALKAFRDHQSNPA